MKAAGFVEVRSGKGSHLLLKHPATGKEVWVEVHTKKDAGRLGNVPGLPVYAAADSHAKAERAVRAVLTEYLNAHPASRPDARVRVARVSDRGKAKVSVVGVAALVGAKRSDAKARASRANGQLGGRPPKDARKRTTRTKASR